MQPSYDEIRRLAQALPEEQRIQLANSLLESVNGAEPEEDSAEVAAAWDAEIKRRLDEIDSGQVKMIPGEEVRDWILGKLSPEARARLRK